VSLGGRRTREAQAATLPGGVRLQAGPVRADYRRNALVPAVAELNQPSFEISYRDHKLGRSVDKVEFSIESRTSPSLKQLLPLEKDIAAGLPALTPW